MNSFVERHQSEISGVLSCFDWVAITGTLPAIAPWRCHGGVAGLPGHPRVRLHPVGGTAARGAAGQSRAPGLAIEFIRRHKLFAKKIASRRSSPRGASTSASSTSSRPWSPAPPIGPGSTRPGAGPAQARGGHVPALLLLHHRCGVARPLVETHRGNLDVRLTAEFHPQFHRVVIRLHREALGRRIALYAVRRGWHKRQSIPTPVSATLAARPSARSQPGRGLV